MLTPRSLARFVSNERMLGESLAALLDAAGAGDADRVANEWLIVEPALLLHFDLEERHLLPGVFASSERQARVLVQEQRHLRSRFAGLKDAVERRELRPEMVRDFIDVLGAHTRNQQRNAAAWTDDAE
jgi:hypothetical protein